MKRLFFDSRGKSITCLIYSDPPDILFHPVSACFMPVSPALDAVKLLIPRSFYRNCGRCFIRFQKNTTHVCHSEEKRVFCMRFSTATMYHRTAQKSRYFEFDVLKLVGMIGYRILPRSRISSSSTASKLPFNVGLSTIWKGAVFASRIKTFEAPK